MSEESVFSGDVDFEELLARSRKQMFQIQALSARLASINDLAAALGSTVDQPTILRLTAEYAQTLLPADHCSVVLRAGNEWRLFTLIDENEFPLTIDADEDLALGYTLRTGNPRLVLNNRGIGLFTLYDSYLVVPVHDGALVTGTLNVAARAQQAYSIEDLRIARQIALLLGSALLTAQRFHDLKRAQEALHRNNAELEARNQELDAYNQIIAHDLKAPLNAIYGYASLLSLFSEEEFGQHGATYVKQIMDAAHHMNGMIEQLLWLAKAHNAPVVPVEIDVVVNRAAQRLEHLFAARGMRLDLDGNLPPALGHEAWIEEIFANLLTNAIKYMGDDPDPYVRVRGTCQGDMCRYEIEDNGIGIEEEHLQTVFQMFTRFNPGEVEGHGLGLSIVARLVRRMGGEVGVESKARVGSTFWFTLPAIHSAET